MSKRILYNITTSTSSSFQAQNVSSGTLNLSTGLTSASAQITNLNATTATVSTLLNTNAVSTNVSSGTLNLSTGLTAASAQITNENVTTSTIATLRNTNAVSTNISSATLNLSTGLTAASAQITNENVTTSTIATLRNTNTISTNVSSGTLNLSTGLTAASAQITNENVTTSTIATLRNTNTISTNITSTNVVATNLSSGTVSATTFTGGSLSLSGNLNVAGTLTTVNITSTNLVNTNVSAGVVVASTSLSATGSSNTIANIFTNSGNVGIGTTSPGECLDVRGNLRLGNSTQGNYIEFYGTSGDSGPYQHTFIGERIYSGEKSELLLFKGNDVASAPGPDRIRHLASNHVFDTYTSSLSGTFDTVGSGGTTRMLIDNSGNVGIGVSNPSLKLEVSGRGVMKNAGTGTSGALFFDDINKGIQYSGNNASVNSYFEGSFPTDGLAVFGFSDGALGTKKDGNRTCLMWTSSGNVGIGTTSPVGRLEVRDSTNFVGDDGGVLYITGGTNGNRRLHMGYVNTGNYGWIESVEKGVNLTNLSLQPRGGNVGIGITSPQTILHLARNGNTTGNILFEPGFTSDGGNAGFSAINFNGYHNAGEQRINTGKNRWRVFTDQRTTSDQMYIDTYNGTTGTTLMSFTTAGNVGIGTSAPQALLHLHNTSMPELILSRYTSNISGGNLNHGELTWKSLNRGVDSAIIRSTSQAVDGLLGFDDAGRLEFLTSTGPGASVRMVISESGNVGIGTTAPGSALHVAGLISATSGNGISMGMGVDGNSGIQLNSGANGSINSSYIDFGYTGNDFTSRIIHFNNNRSLQFLVNGGTTAMSLQSSGSVSIPGALSKGSGTFDIDHPILEDKRLVHSFIEGPRCDLIYRGAVTLTNGTVTVNIDTDCVEEMDCVMTEGTFTSLCANPQFFLQNPNSFNRLRGSISGNILTIICEDNTSTDEVYWQVIAERKDPFIKRWNRTNANGYLVTEYNKE